MKHSTDRILTTHAGSLSRPADLIAINRARAAGEKIDDVSYEQCLAEAVAGVVRKQREVGVDVPDDGEFGKPMSANYDGNMLSYGGLVAPRRGPSMFFA
jgi:5-methyltetrahydropteroyltriglutamate--homocysteine methyltransferase